MPIVVTPSATPIDPNIVLWSEFYDHIMPELPGVQPALVDHWLRQVAIDFCQDTCVHTTEVTPIDIVADTATYDLSSPIDETEVFMVKAVWYDDVPLDIAPADVLDRYFTYWPSVTDTQPSCYTHSRPDQITLYPTPDTALVGGLRVKVVLRPTLIATGLASWVFTRYLRAISMGVKGRLMEMQGKPWTNLQIAAANLSEYRSAKAVARGEVSRSFTRGVLSVQPRPIR